ncbi:hypothetical protein ACIRBX_26450 [Kitasatospora sp. NPDC096147]
MYYQDPFAAPAIQAAVRTCRDGFDARPELRPGAPTGPRTVGDGR